MTVFKTFWKVLNKNKITVIIYTIILLVFGVSNMKTNSQSMSFQAKKPDIAIINNDKDSIFSKGLVEYIERNSIVKNFENTDELDDALFYREVNYIVYIPENYGKDFMEGKNPELIVKSTGDYEASYAEMIVTKFVQMSNTCIEGTESEEELVNKVNEILKNEVKVEMTTKLDSTAMQKTTVYYNFASYSLIACLVFMIGLIINSFNDVKIKKRIIISSENYKKHNRMLLISNCCYSLIMWALYVLVSIIILKEVMLSIRGLVYILNSFVFTICITTLSFFIANLVSNKEALSGISNVISLGSSFLCGAFVPLKWLPDFVVKVAHIFPTYYYIDSNEKIGVIEEISLKTMEPIIFNTIIVLVFSLIFIVLSNIVVKQKRKIG